MYLFRRWAHEKYLEKESVNRNIIRNKIRKNLLSEDTNLILHCDDEEFYKGLSEFQKSKVLTQYQHTLKALAIVSNTYGENMNTTCREAFTQACDDLLSKHSGRTVEFWFKFCKENNQKIPTLKEGTRKVTKDYNPFLKIADKETKNYVEIIKIYSHN